MKPSFLNCEKPLITTMIQKKQISDVMYTIEKTLEVGTDASCVQLCKLLPKFQNAECYKKIFSKMQGKPIYATNYRRGSNEGLSDEVLAEGLIEIAKCGATLCDVMGDIFDKHPDELTMDPIAVDKQKRLIDDMYLL